MDGIIVPAWKSVADIRRVGTQATKNWNTMNQSANTLLNKTDILRLSMRSNGCSQMNGQYSVLFAWSHAV